jgi:hypothetical protein
MSRYTGDVDAIVVWRSYHCDTLYSVSLCDDEGGEIVCVGGDDDEDEAWRQACAEADVRGVPARQEYESGEVWRAYTPGEEG